MGWVGIVLSRVLMVVAAAGSPDFSPVWSAWSPREPAPICEWVERNIYFSAKVGAVAGYWSHSEFPYSRGVLEALADDEIAEVVLQFGTQLGKTSSLAGYLAWRASQDPRPALVATPDEKSAEEFQRVKLRPILEATDSLKSLVPPLRQFKKTALDLGAQIIYFGWSGARWTVSGRSCADVLITETNLHNRAASAEGDPVEMARDRVKAFARYKILVEGKPSEKGSCRVEQLYQQSDQRHYQVPCPHCGKYQILARGSRGSVGGLKWRSDPQGDVIAASVHYQCTHCKKPIAHRAKLPMLARGVWVPRGQAVTARGKLTGTPERPPVIAGFQLSSLYSSRISWADYARAFVAAARGPLAAIKNFVQSWDGEAFELPGRRPLAEEIAEHRGAYRLGIVPEPALALIMTVDVQETGVWYVLRAWSYGARSFLVRYGYLQTLADLAKLFPVCYSGGAAGDGARYAISECWIDSGYRTTEVYEFCARYNCVPIKGAHQFTQAGLVAPLKVPKWKLEGWHIDKGQAADQFFLRRLQGRRGDPGFWEFAEDAGGDYTRSLVAYERKEQKDKWGRRRKYWVSVDEAHEHLADCELYQEAAAFLFGYAFAEPPQGSGVRSQETAANRSGITTPDGRPYLVTERSQ